MVWGSAGGGKRTGVGQGIRVRETKLMAKSAESKLKCRTQRPTPGPTGMGCEWAQDPEPGLGDELKEAARNKQAVSLAPQASGCSQKGA